MKKRKIIPIIALSTILGMGVVSITSCGNETTNQATYTVTYQESSDYTITGLESSYSSGATVSFTVTVNNSAKEIDSVAVNGSKLSGTGSYSFKMPSENVTIVVTLKDKAEDPAPVEHELTVEASSSSVIVGERITLVVKFDGGAVQNYTVTSADSTIVSVGEDGTILAVGAGSTVLTVKHTSEGVDYTSTVNITVTDDEMGEYEVVEKGKFGLWQQTIEETLYFNGLMDGFYLGTTTDYNEGVTVTAYKASETGVYLRITEQTSQNDKKYIAAKVSKGTDGKDHNNIIIADEPFEWTINSQYDAYTAVLENEKEVYIGNYSSFDTISLSEMSHIDGSDTNIARLYQEPIANFSASISTTTLSLGKSYSITASFNGTEISEGLTITADDEEAFEINGTTIKGLKTGDFVLTVKYTDGDQNSYEDKIEVSVSEDIMADKKVVETGKFGLWHQSNNEPQYFNGLMAQQYYFGTTTNYSEAVTVTAYEAGEDSVYLRITEGNSENKFIGARYNDGHNNILMMDEPYEWTYNSQYDAYTTKKKKKELFIGNTTYDTLSLNYFDSIASANVAHIVQEEILMFTASISSTNLALNESYEITGKLNGNEVEGDLTVTANNPEAFEITGSTVKPIKLGNFTLTVKYTADGKTYTDTIEVSVKEEITEYKFTWTEDTGKISDDGLVMTFNMGDMFNVRQENTKATDSSSNPRKAAQWRIYTDNLVTISSDNYLITGVYFTDVNNKDNVSITPKSENFSVSNVDRDWSLTVNDQAGVPSISFSPSAQIRVEEMIISYVEK